MPISILSGEVRNLLAAGFVTGSPVLGLPAVGQNPDLTADDVVAGAAVLESPDLGQTHELTASGVTAGAPAVESPTLDADPSAAEADWQARISGPGVVWYHDFRNEAEVDAFRWDGGFGNDPDDVSDPGKTIRNTSLGITGGGCLELIYSTTTSSAPGFRRPFAAFSGSGNGKGVDDPGASGSMAVSVKAWDPTDRSENEDFRESYYAHPDQIGVDGWTADKFDGREFFIQYRYRETASRRDPNTPVAGKRAFVATTQQTLNQELVVMNDRSGLWRWYTNFGSSPDTGGALGISSGNKQPGGDFPDCDNSAGSGLCYVYPTDEWITCLIHVVPGHHNVKDTELRFYVKEDGWNNYLKIFDWTSTINFSPTSTGHPRGYNEFQPSNYMNNVSSDVEWSQYYDQIIHSKMWIPAPDTSTSVLATAALALNPGEWDDVTPNTTQNQHDIQWQLRTIFYDPQRRELQYMGKPASGQSTNYSHYVYAEHNDTWSASSTTLFSGLGHVWGGTFDWTTGDYWFHRYSDDVLRRFTRQDGVSAGSWSTTATSPNDLDDGNISSPLHGYHPNLYGQGVPGVYVQGAFRGNAYNPADDSWDRITATAFPSSNAFRNRNNGQGIYMPGIDALVFWASSGNSPTDATHAMIVHAGAGNESEALSTGFLEVGGEPPIEITGAGGTTNHGHVITHPDDPNVLLILEEHGTERVWRSDDYGATWSLQGYTHPFITGLSPNMSALNSGEFTIGVIEPYGVIVGMTSSSSGGTTRIWKPNS